MLDGRGGAQRAGLIWDLKGGTEELISDGRGGLLTSERCSRASCRMGDTGSVPQEAQFEL